MTIFTCKKESGSEKLTGIGILERSLPMLFFMMLHKEKEMSGLSGTLDLRCLPPVLDLRRIHENMKTINNNWIVILK